MSLPSSTRKLGIWTLLLCITFSGCSWRPKTEAIALQNKHYLPEPDTQLVHASLGHCSGKGNKPLLVNSTQPITIIVHGCFSSAGRFRALADVYAFHGQQTACFEYDDRASLESTSAALLDALNEVKTKMPRAEITILGHSQGGLVARRAIVNDRPDELITIAENITLATVSTPFSGITAAEHCGWPLLTYLSLGLVKPICYLVTGSKYKEITPTSEFINKPGNMVEAVKRHVLIATDERDTCRAYNSIGKCSQDDYVFSLEEQRHLVVENDHRVEPVVISAGHAEIVGNEIIEPLKLIKNLQKHGIMRATPEDKQQELAALLKQLFTSP